MLDNTLPDLDQPAGIDFSIPSSPNAKWPLITDHPQHDEIAYRTAAGDVVGRSGRAFGASRADGARRHVGIDLFASHGDVVVACEPGEIVNHYHFYSGTYALIQQTDGGVVINYGEVEGKSWEEFGLTIGSKVAAGQSIARVGKLGSGASMLHFETYKAGTIANKQWRSDQMPPDEILNPTKYLLTLRG